MLYYCQLCNSKRFQQNFQNWTSGNHEVNEFIQKIKKLQNGLSMIDLKMLNIWPKGDLELFLKQFGKMEKVYICETLYAIY